MELNRRYKLLRIFTGELDKLNGMCLYEAIVLAAKKQGLQGATVLRGILSFGSGSRMHSTKLLDLSFDLPIVIEILDTEENIEKFIEVVCPMVDQSGGGALITMETAEVVYYRGKKE